MFLNISQNLEVSLSLESFQDKKISGAMIGSSKVKENRITRKEYGFPANRGVSFKRTPLSALDLYNKLREGFVFCHLFNPEVQRKDGSFGSSQKKDCNFYGSWIIGVDIDETKYRSAEEFVEKLTQKPTFVYTSYSNLLPGKGARFRLVYIFDHLIQNPYFFRYCSSQLLSQIEKDTGEKVKDDCSLRCSQFFNGTFANNPQINFWSEFFGCIYSFSDFDISEEGFIDFLSLKYAGYKTRSIGKTQDISSLLTRLTGKKYTYDPKSSQFSSRPDIINNSLSFNVDDNNSLLISSSLLDLEKGNKINDTSFSLLEDDNNSLLISSSLLDLEKGTKDVNTSLSFTPSDELVYQMETLDFDTFMKYNRHKYKVVSRIEKEDWIDGIYQFVGDDYFSLFHYNSQVKDGNKRRKKLFRDMCLRRLIDPKITPDTLLFNAYLDMNRYFEIDKDLTINCLKRNVENAMSLELLEIEDMYSEFIKYLREKRRPKSGIILKKGTTETLVEYNETLKKIKWDLIEDYYDKSLSVKENLEIIISQELFPIKKSSLYYFCKEKGYITPGKMDDEELIGWLDEELTFRENREYLRENGIKCKNDRLLRLLRQLRNQ